MTYRKAEYRIRGGGRGNAGHGPGRAPAAGPGRAPAQGRSRPACSTVRARKRCRTVDTAWSSLVLECLLGQSAVYSYSSVAIDPGMSVGWLCSDVKNLYNIIIRAPGSPGCSITGAERHGQGFFDLPPRG